MPPFWFPLREAVPLGDPVWAGAKRCRLLVTYLGFPWEAVLWHSWCCWSMSPLTPASLAALFQWLMQLPWKLQQSPKLSHSGMEIVFWSPAVPTELSAVFLPLILTTTVFLMYDKGKVKVGVNCQPRAERGSSLGQLIGESSVMCWTLNIIYGWKIFL